MPRWDRVQPPRRAGGEEGFSLTEVLITLAITAMVGVAITSVLTSIAANSHRDLQQTDYYESLRLAAHMIMADARFATAAASIDFGQSLSLNLDPGGNHYVRYIFATWDGSADGVPDPTNLHRWEVQGGSLLRDEIVATDLVLPDFTRSDTTWFEASTGSGSRSAKAILVKAPLKGQEQPFRLEIFALLR